MPALQDCGRGRRSATSPDAAYRPRNRQDLISIQLTPHHALGVDQDRAGLGLGQSEEEGRSLGLADGVTPRVPVSERGPVGKDRIDRPIAQGTQLDHVALLTDEHEQLGADQGPVDPLARGHAALHPRG